MEDVLGKLADKLGTENITYFLGPGAAFGGSPMPAQGCDIARELLSDLKIIGAAYKELLPPVGVAGMYYAVRSGDRDLEKKVMERMAESSKTFPAAHGQLAGLLKKLHLPSRPAPRGVSRVRQLIVTTNFDLMMKRALLRAGLSFTRIVEYRSGEQLDINQYSHVQLNADGTVQLPSASGFVLVAVVAFLSLIPKGIFTDEARYISMGSIPFAMGCACAFASIDLASPPARRGGSGMSGPIIAHCSSVNSSTRLFAMRRI